ncbi:hypothetical protein LCGC14_1295720 [marine sediment metagenome]|uniref:Uncharacterized protein n=1 Tax=marine sediment metagenome TaxID=412755 RepID=A0A0F9N7P1_9ZZZZ
MVTEMFPLVRRDALPEDSTYIDDGCEVAPSCLSCPLLVCRYDRPAGLRSLRSEARMDLAAEFRSKGYSANGTAVAMELSKRQVYRLWATARQRNGDIGLSEVETNRGIVVLMGECSNGRA